VAVKSLQDQKSLQIFPSINSFIRKKKLHLGLFNGKNLQSIQFSPPNLNSSFHSTPSNLNIQFAVISIIQMTKRLSLRSLIYLMQINDTKNLKRFL
jgi:hypothetical protein